MSGSGSRWETRNTPPRWRGSRAHRTWTVPADPRFPGSVVEVSGPGHVADLNFRVPQVARRDVEGVAHVGGGQGAERYVQAVGDGGAGEQVDVDGAAGAVGAFEGGVADGFRGDGNVIEVLEQEGQDGAAGGSVGGALVGPLDRKSVV